MRIPKYSNDNIKTRYNEVILFHPVIPSIIELLCKDNEFQIIDIINDDFVTQVIISINNRLINICIDTLSKKIKIVDLNKNYYEVYDELPTKKIIPCEYEYHNNERILIKKNNINFCIDDKTNFFYELTINNNQYTFIISNSNNKFDEDKFINYLLNKYVVVNSVRELFLAILLFANYREFDFKIADSKGSSIVMNNGKLVKYNEIIENDNSYSKIFLENNEFYIEKKVKEIYQDEDTILIKKIGECHGKEKR